MERKPEQKKCDYCGKPIPQEETGPGTPWLYEKAGYGLRVIRWRPQSRPVWDLDAFYQLCKFACAEALILDFVKKEKWNVGEEKVKTEIASSNA